MFDLLLETFTSWLGSPGLAIGAIVTLSFIFVLSFVIVLREVLAWFLKIQRLRKEIHQLQSQLERIESQMTQLHMRSPAASDDAAPAPPVEEKPQSTVREDSPSKRFVMSSDNKAIRPKVMNKKGQFHIQ